MLFPLCRCIPIWWKCDGRRDCLDGSDEPVTCPQRFCALGMFQCTDGNCTSSHSLCNLRRDCPDGSDEDPVLCGEWNPSLRSLPTSGVDHVQSWFCGGFLNVKSKSGPKSWGRKKTTQSPSHICKLSILVVFCCVLYIESSLRANIEGEIRDSRISNRDSQL